MVPVKSVLGPATGAPAPRPTSAPSARPPAEWITPFDMSDAGPAPSGANWGRCALHFTPEGKPDLDVMRLGLMCGPSNGMHRVVLGPKQHSGGVGRVELRFPAHAGDCFRLLVVGEQGAGRIEVELADAHGKLLAKQSGRRRWTMLGLDGPVCVPDAGQYHAKVHAERGQLAVELWRLR